ncbi:hypothetical protein [Rheinheimera soli]|uniref:Uncharacterized protein n=1 Tax=Rheinheimera soli TaxID=443616 RepID=A0ABU1VWT4_9GAMM|nr:hypothetical protein [Rheinheimera soli]MDR7120060.1 hypothetical protein [Rheinheimera soli]
MNAVIVDKKAKYQNRSVGSFKNIPDSEGLDRREETLATTQKGLNSKAAKPGKNLIIQLRI